ncbi:MAG: leucine-rich repeat domain-containing protein, partial [Alistipes sp.]|nr:leucine-rich repeat domain-containing protein [Alistipes sp.]
MVKFSSNSLSIERNHIQPMAEFSYTANISPSNQIWYTSSDGNVVEPYNTDVFGANIISNTYNNGMGVITFDGVVTTIGEGAFADCASLTSVNIPDSVTTIGDSAFAYCYSLTSVNIPDSVTTIGDSAFGYCYSLTSVNIPDSVTTIGNNAFYSCDSLTSVNIPDSVTTIGEATFYKCSLTSVAI